MCNIYNSVGCLTVVKSHLNQYNITEFKSLNEVITFQKSYKNLRQTIITNSEVEIEKEKNKILSENLELNTLIESTKESAKNELLYQVGYLKTQLQSLASSNPNNILRRVIIYFKVTKLKKKIYRQEDELQLNISRSVEHLVAIYQRNEARYNYIKSNFQDAVINNCTAELRALDRKKAIIDEVNNSIYGAIGEQKVVKELENLSDEYFLINDFCLSFTPPIFNRAENDHIKSIQIDHLLIGPSGVFLIETKNWSEQSINSLSLRSPVSQLKRTNFALFTVLNHITEGLNLNQHHWGKRKISPKNILVLINQKPLEEFQYVKVLTLSQLLGYIKYFPPIFTQNETENIANQLISLSRS